MTPRGLVLDPRGIRTAKERARPLPEGGLRLEGLRIGIRHDGAWRSWTCVSEEWARRLSEAGAAVHFWRSGSRVGEEAARLEEELAPIGHGGSIGLENIGQFVIAAPGQTGKTLIVQDLPDGGTA